MPRTIRIDGDEWLVIGATETSMFLVNPAARHRREITALRAQLATLEAQLACAERPAAVSGAPIEGP